MFYGNLFALGSQVTLLSDILRHLSFFFDGIIYSLIPSVFSLIYELYDLSSIFNDTTATKTLINNFTTTIYSFLAIFMFFRVAFSLLGMLVDPSKIDDKDAGASKIVKNILITLALIVVVPSDTAIIFPFFTFATLSLSLAHAAILYVALVGSIVAVKVSSLPASKFKDVLFNVIDVASTTGKSPFA